MVCRFLSCLELRESFLKLLLGYGLDDLAPHILRFPNVFVRIELPISDSAMSTPRKRKSSAIITSPHFRCIMSTSTE
jgi:hypothetical protein